MFLTKRFREKISQGKRQQVFIYAVLQTHSQNS